MCACVGLQGLQRVFASLVVCVFSQGLYDIQQSHKLSQYVETQGQLWRTGYDIKWYKGASNYYVEPLRKYTRFFDHGVEIHQGLIDTHREDTDRTRRRHESKQKIGNTKIRVSCTGYTVQTYKCQKYEESSRHRVTSEECCINRKTKTKAMPGSTQLIGVRSIYLGTNSRSGANVSIAFVYCCYYRYCYCQCCCCSPLACQAAVMLLVQFGSFACIHYTTLRRACCCSRVQRW